MSKFRKTLSLFLSLALLMSSVFVGGVVASAQTSLYTTVNTYDETSVTLNPVTNDNQPAIQAGSSTPFFGSYGATVVDSPLNANDGKVVLFDRVKAPEDKWPAAVRIYEQGNDYAHFMPKTSTTYEVTVKYYVKTAPGNSNINIQVRLTPHSQLYGNGVYAYANHTIWNIGSIKAGETTNGWVTTTAKITTTESQGYFGLFLASDNKAMTGIKVYVDDITVRECTDLTVHNFDGSDKTVQITDQTTIAEIEVPAREGAIFNGVFADEDLTTEIPNAAKAINYINDGIFYNWNVLAEGEFHTGFESFAQDTNGISFDEAVTSIDSSMSFIGAKSIKNEVSKGKFVSFELRENKAFKVKKDTEYTISFAYNSNEEVYLYAGLGIASNVPGTAYALKETYLPNTNGVWSTASINVVFDNNLADGYVPVFMLKSETDAYVYFDDILVSYAPERVAMFSSAPKATNTDVSVETSTGTVKHFTVKVDKNQKTLPETWPDASYDVSNLTEIECVLKLPTNYSEDGPPVPIIMFAEGYGQYITDSSWHGTKMSQFTTQGYAVFEVDNIENKDFGIKDLGAPAKVRAAMKAFEHIKEFYNVQDKMITIGVSNGTLLALEIMDWYPEVVSCGIIGGPNVSLEESYIASDNWNTGQNSVAIYYDFANKNNYYASSAHNRGTGQYDSSVGLLYDFYGHMYTEDDVQYLDKEIAPVLFLIGEDEPSTPKNNAIKVSAALANSGNTVVVKRYTSTGHDAVCSISREDIREDALTFMEQYKGYGCEHENLINVEAKSSTCVANGNEAYSKCYDCGTVVSGSAAALPLLDHAYDDEDDVFCNNCNNPKTLWDGKLSQPTATNNGYILISNASELAWVISNGGSADAKYMLTDDIYINSPSKVDWSTGRSLDSDYTINSWFDHAKSFQGEIDGNGCVVYGLYWNSPGSSSGLYGTGLIPLASGNATIKNLGVDCAYMNSHSASAFVGVAGNNIAITIDKCYAGEDVTLVAGRDAGVFGGRIQGTVTVTNCYSLASATGGTSNGLLGDIWSSSTIDNSYNANGPVSYGTNTSYFVKATNVYATSVSQSADGTKIMKTPVVITSDRMQGDSALSAMVIGNAFEATDSYPTLKVFNRSNIVVPEVCEHSYDDFYDATCNDCGFVRNVPARPTVIWDGSTTEPTAKDDNGNILISTPSELAYIIYNGGGVDKNYKLTADIYLNDISKINWQNGVVSGGYSVKSWYDEWKPNNTLADFKGNIDGDGHIVYGLYLENNPTSYSAYHQGTGLIPRLAAGANTTIKNLGIDYAYLHHANSVAAFVGSTVDGSILTIDSCYAGENVTLKGFAVGVFRAYARKSYGGSITNSYSLATINGTNFNGLIGEVWDDGYEIVVSNCYNAKGGVTTHNHTTQVASSNNYVTNNTGLTEGTIVINAVKMQGADVFTAADKMPNLNNNGKFVATNSYPVLKVFPIILPDCEHEYDNVCDAECNKCGETRITVDHVYDNGCDTVCNECGETRAAQDHVYDNVCDTDCNECGDIRQVGDHVYDDEYDADCNACGAIRVVDENPADFDDSGVKSYLAYQSNKSVNYIYVSSASDLAVASRLLNENSDIDFIVLNGFNATIDTDKPIVSFGTTNTYVDINNKKVRVILLTGSADADMSWFVNTALTANDDWNYVVISDEEVAERPANGVIGDADQTLWKILYDFQNKNLYLYESLGINADWTTETSKILSYQLIGAQEDANTYRSDINLWVVATSTFDIVTANQNIVFKYDIKEDIEEYMLSTSLYPEGDVNLDNIIDICDLVKYNIIVNKLALPSTRVNNLDHAKICSFIFGTPVYLPVYYQKHVSEKADEVNALLANASDNTAVYLYWTDAHWNRNYENSYKMLQYMAQTTPANHTIFGGDVANDDDPTADDINEWRELTLRLPNHHSVVGNHEYTSPHLAVDGERAQSYSNIYNFLLAPEFEQFGVTDSLGENQLCYYVDNESEKTRYMFLKCSRGPESGATYEEFKWAVESLNSTPDGWHIVMIGHEWLNGTSYAQPNCRAFGKLADAYNARKVGTTDFFSVAYDFTDAGATVEYIIGGDNHTDIDNAKSTGQIPVITLETDCVRGEPTAIGGTISENCVNVIIADYDNNTINVVRIGRDDDKAINMNPNGKTPTTITSDITDVNGDYITDYIDLSKIKVNNYRCRNDAYLIISGGSTTASDYIVEFYNYDSATGTYNVATSYNVTLGVGSWTFKAGNTPVSYTYPVVYDIRGESIYVDLTAVAFRHNHTNTYPGFARVKYKNDTSGITVDYTLPK